MKHYKNHTTSWQQQGEFMDTIYTPVCSYGWQGRPEAVTNDWFPTVLMEREQAHIDAIKLTEKLT